MKKPRIVVLGAINMDLVISCPKLPGAGETVKGTAFNQFPGGKGANQAVAAAKMGGDVLILGAVGNDQFGNILLENMKSVGIDVGRVEVRDGVSTGIALIMVDAKGQNLISFFPGANGEIDKSLIDSSLGVVKGADAFLVQLECPSKIIEYAIEMCSGCGVPVLLNPAPAIPISEGVLKKCTVVMPNETEAEIMTGIKVDNEENAREASEALLRKGCKNSIITLGERGAYFLGSRRKGKLIPAPKVHSIDTVAAGDVFAGAFAVYSITQNDMERAIEYANYAAALSTTRKGAQPSIPDIEEVEYLIHE
jgi:ribokinase